MNDTLMPVRSLDLDRHEALAAASTDSVRLALVDRLSLRLGLWLLLRGARSLDRTRDHDSRAHDLAAASARTAREQAAQREHLLRAVRA